MTSYYDLAAANARVHELRPLLAALRDDRDAIAASQRRVRQLAADASQNLAEAERAAQLEHEQEQMTVTVRRMERTVRQIDAWGITLRDIGSGLVDFPALASGRPVWLCWKLGEPTLSFTHGQDATCSARRPLSGELGPRG